MACKSHSRRTSRRTCRRRGKIFALASTSARRETRARAHAIRFKLRRRACHGRRLCAVVCGRLGRERAPSRAGACGKISSPVARGERVLRLASGDESSETREQVTKNTRIRALEINEGTRVTTERARDVLPRFTSDHVQRQVSGRELLCDVALLRLRAATTIRRNGTRRYVARETRIRAVARSHRRGAFQRRRRKHRAPRRRRRNRVATFLTFSLSQPLVGLKP